MFEIELLKNKKPKKYPITLITCISLLVLIILACILKTYDTLNVISLSETNKNNCVLTFKVPYDKIDILNNAIVFKNNKDYKINNIKYEETFLENNILYEQVKLSTNMKCNNKIEKIKIKNNKQRIIEKILKTIKEG